MFHRGHEDKKLIRRLLAGHEAAFEEFFGEYFPRLYRFALVRVDNDPQIAEEVTQATLCAVLDKLSTFRGEAGLFTWICTFCRHEISAYFQANRHRRREQSLLEDTPEIRAVLESLADECEHPLESLKRKEVVRLVQVTLDHLSPKYRQVLEWKYLQGWPVQRIAERLNLKLKAAESLLVRARQAFRDGFSSLAAEIAAHERSLAGGAP
ncbi:Sigma-70 family RNA polymerase sigma factor [Sulfidibacter corallicola]|uniref:Sigma-70 family RNA polymerase sigma factor n=1 Tax=Sulfidibacter corallicola TaxID=2818388 RepID=A0A8A4TL64_SULCO|nr:sigma-70 family RNA polymerase sigma factor [Sulfidibacter corallicola]QTD49862.1 sigma-70 family RNA polymerase sigma factor [Sulfidibacter corallicola]